MKLSMTLLVAAAAGSAIAAPFSIAHIPDTQKASEFQNRAWTFAAITEEIADLRDDLAIAFAIHTGDIVQNGTVAGEWERADFAMSILDGVVPFTTVIGNHDWATTNDKSSSVERYLALFGPARHAEQPGYIGSDPSGLNHAMMFDAGGRTFLVLTLEWRPETTGGAVFSWAQGVIDANPGVPTIIATHEHLFDGADADGVATRSDTGEAIFDALVRANDQVFLVLGGHYHVRNSGVDQGGSEGERRRVSLNDAGRPVVEILANYQDEPIGGQGVYRIVTIDEDAGEIRVDTRSAVYGPDFRFNDDTSDFTIPLDLAARFERSEVGNFRVLPYQMAPTAGGITLAWFTADDTPGTLTVTGPGLDRPLVIESEPELVPLLDYTIPAELNDTRAATPFATTAVRNPDGTPARNVRHEIVLDGLIAGERYAYTVTQGATTYGNTFRTAPTPDTAEPIRFGVFSDSETLIVGRSTFREWAPTTPQAPGSTGRPAGNGPGRDRYLVTETEGYRANIAFLESRNPDMIIMPGDLIQGTGNEQQRRWDEFWRHNAGAYDDLLSGRPLTAAIGNNCIFNGTGNAQTLPTTNELISYARQQWSAYFTWPSDGVNPAYEDLYYRTDYGPVTIITLCSVKAVEEANAGVAPPTGQGLSPDFPANRDTNRAWFVTPYEQADIPDFNAGTEQHDWALAQLADARARGQIIFLQWHHTPFSRGIHGSSVTSNQSGEAMRIYAPIAEQFRVAGILAGHSELGEMSYLDLDADGFGVHAWDVGFAGDGLRGVEDSPAATNNAITAWRNNPVNPEGAAFEMNPHSVWTADQDEPELWDGRRLISGGKHYGFLEIDVTPEGNGEFTVSFRNWHTFPLNAGDENFTVTGFELRPYNNDVTLRGPADNLRPIPAATRGRNADLNGDGRLDVLDIIAFFDLLGAADPAADLTADGRADLFDVIAFFDRFGAGL